ncbi:caspase-6-like [Culicoides brevitarsis]|uniref:caspase-6-like n=1 Tax=Culicoides brevitarsis TaxID=469753 RepID=UPI00307B6D54
MGRKRNKKPSKNFICRKCSEKTIKVSSEELQTLQNMQITEKVAPKKLFDTPDASASNECDSEDETAKYNPELAIPVTISDNDRYDKSRKLNGSAVIFNFENFRNSKMYPKREGSTKDVKRLSEMFEKLNIDIPEDRIYENLSHSSMITKIKELKSMTPLLSDSNALIVVILSHGLEHDNVMAADRSFSLNDIIDMFTPEELPEMATRPKIFLVQACRGDKLDSGAILKEQKFTFDQVDSGIEEIPFNYPSHADVCVAYSSHHGHYSFRNANGSWFIQEFCNVLEEIDLKQNHFLDILAQTNAKVAVRGTSSEDVKFDDKKQISSFYSTFTKKFYLSD